MRNPNQTPPEGDELLLWASHLHYRAHEAMQPGDILWAQGSRNLAAATAIYDQLGLELQCPYSTGDQSTE